MESIFKKCRKKSGVYLFWKRTSSDSKTVSYIITDKFIEANMEKLLKFNIIKGDQLWKVRKEDLTNLNIWKNWTEKFKLRKGWKEEFTRSN